MSLCYGVRKALKRGFPFLLVRLDFTASYQPFASVKLFLQGLTEKMIAVPSLILSTIHGPIGIIQQFILMVTVIRIDADANAGTDEQFAVG